MDFWQRVFFFLNSLPCPTLRFPPHSLRLPGKDIIVKHSMGENLVEIWYEWEFRSMKLSMGENLVEIQCTQPLAYLSVHHHFFCGFHRAFVQVECVLSISLYLNKLLHKMVLFPIPTKYFFSPGMLMPHSCWFSGLIFGLIRISSAKSGT